MTYAVPTPGPGTERLRTDTAYMQGSPLGLVTRYGVSMKSAALLFILESNQGGDDPAPRKGTASTAALAPRPCTTMDNDVGWRSAHPPFDLLIGGTREIHVADLLR